MANHPETDRLKVSVVIPCRNEEGALAAVIEGCLPHCDELVVVDGHSSDGTRELAERLGARVLLDGGKGKGDGIRLGLKEARGDVVVLIDGDGSHEPADIPRLVEPIARGDADLVVASRMLGGSDEIHGNFSNYIRMVGAGLITLIINLRWKTELTDCENGYRAVRRSKALELGLSANDFDIEQEMVMRALKRGLPVTEVASHEYERQAGASKLPTYRGLIFLWRLLVEMLTR
jgi:dolichol-phosphate mannosyltransferase